jgi:hypothetical protein
MGSMELQCTGYNLMRNENECRNYLNISSSKVPIPENVPKELHNEQIQKKLKLALADLKENLSTLIN